MKHDIRIALEGLASPYYIDVLVQGYELTSQLKAEGMDFDLNNAIMSADNDDIMALPLKIGEIILYGCFQIFNTYGIVVDTTDVASCLPIVNAILQMELDDAGDGLDETLFDTDPVDTFSRIVEARTSTRHEDVAEILVSVNPKELVAIYESKIAPLEPAGDSTTVKDLDKRRSALRILFEKADALPASDQYLARQYIEMGRGFDTDYGEIIEDNLAWLDFQSRRRVGMELALLYYYTNAYTKFSSFGELVHDYDDDPRFALDTMTFINNIIEL